MKKFTLGMAAGATSLAVVIPLLAQMTSAASSDAASLAGTRSLPVPTQACVQALVGRDAAQLSAIDDMTAARKTALQAHKDALAAAATLTDDTARQEAVSQANEAFRTTMQTVRDSDAMQAARDAMQEECGNAGMGFGNMMKFGNGGGMGMMGGGRTGFHRGNPEAMADKLGMTAEELQAALESGKLMHEIAEEQGVTLPQGAGRGMRGGMRGGQTPSTDSNGK